MTRVDSTHHDPSDPDHPQRNTPIRGYQYVLGYFRDRSFFIREGGGKLMAGGYLGLPFKYRMTHPYGPLIGMTPPPPEKNLNKQYSDFNFFFNILCWPSTTNSWVFFFKKKKIKRKRSVWNLLVMARPKRVAFSLSVASSSSELMKVW